jgi:hypothetical protein
MKYANMIGRGLADVSARANIGISPFLSACRMTMEGCPGSCSMSIKWTVSSKVKAVRT